MARIVTAQLCDQTLPNIAFGGGAQVPTSISVTPIIIVSNYFTAGPVLQQRDPIAGDVIFSGGDMFPNTNTGGFYPNGAPWYITSVGPHVSNNSILNAPTARTLTTCAETYNCKVDKNGNNGCVNPGDGSGVYNSITFTGNPLLDCQNNCISETVYGDVLQNDSPTPGWADVIVDNRLCLNDVLACPCGWTYGPDGNGVYRCLSPDYNWFEQQYQALGYIPHGQHPAGSHIFMQMVGAWHIPCANRQGLLNPQVGMTFDGNTINGLFNNLGANFYVEGGPFTNNPTPGIISHTAMEIVEVNPAENSSILTNHYNLFEVPCDGCPRGVSTGVPTYQQFLNDPTGFC